MPMSDQVTMQLIVKTEEKQKYRGWKAKRAQKGKMTKNLLTYEGIYAHHHPFRRDPKATNANLCWIAYPNKGARKVGRWQHAYEG